MVSMTESQMTIGYIPTRKELIDFIEDKYYKYRQTRYSKTISNALNKLLRQRA